MTNQKSISNENGKANSPLTNQR